MHTKAGVTQDWPGTHTPYGSHTSHNNRHSARRATALYMQGCSVGGGVEDGGVEGGGVEGGGVEGGGVEVVLTRL